MLRTTCVTALLLVSSMVMSARGADPSDNEYRPMGGAMWWAPYEFDGRTVDLFHLDGKAEAEAADIDLSQLETSADQPAEEKVGANSVNNANPTGEAGAIRGSVQLVAEGRFRGGLRFTGGDGVMVVQAKSDQDYSRIDDRALEFWLKLDEYPQESATLFSFFKTQKPPMSLVIHKDGALKLVVNRNELPVGSFTCPLKKWVHLAFMLGPGPQGNNAVVYIDGHEIWRTVFKDFKYTYEMPELQLQSFTIGNDQGGKSGIKGMVDEVRLSSSSRRLYDSDMEWTRIVSTNTAGGTRVSEDGYPFFRDRGDLIFQSDFDYTLKPSVSPVAVTFPEYKVTPGEIDLSPKEVQKRFQSGVSGQAVVVGKDGLFPAYAGFTNLTARAGTLSFWMRPVDWDNYLAENPYDKIDPRNVPIFYLLGEFPKDRRPPEWSATVPLARFAVFQNPLNPFDAVNVTPGTWNHFAFTWETNTTQCYVNGKVWQGAPSFIFALCDDYRFKGKGAEFWPAARITTLGFGEQEPHPRRNEPHTLVDDFRLFGRVLTEVEIGNLMALRDRRIAMKPLPALELQFEGNGVLGKVDAGVYALMKDYLKAATATVRVLKANDRSVVGATEMVLDDRRQGHGTVRGQFDFGAYHIEADVKDAAGTVLGTATQTWDRVQPPWWQCKAGLSDKVMPEWTPVKAVDNTISVWGRDIIFDGSGLPKKIISAGEDVLAQPITMTVTREGKALALAPAGDRIQVVAQKDTRVDVKGLVKGPDLQVTTESYTEFDGMMWFTITLAPEAGKPSSVDGVTLRIPFQGQNAELIHWWSGAQDFRNWDCGGGGRNVFIGATPPGEGLVFRSSDSNTVHRNPPVRGNFIPYVCLTGNQRGMAWFGENDKGWTQSTNVPAVAVERSGKMVTLVLNVISSPVLLEGPRTFAFGLHPVPVKPRDPDWRMNPNWGVFPDVFCGNNLKARDGSIASAGAFLVYVENGDWAAAHKRYEDGGGSSIKRLYEERWDGFQKTYGREPKPREISYPGLYWDMQWSGSTPADGTQEWLPAWWGSGTPSYAPEFVDFCSWAWDEWLKHGDVKGAYVDDCWPAPQTKLPSLVAYALPDGQVQPGYPIRGYRERFKRMRQISYDRGIVPHLCAHTTHTFYIPYHAFFDVILDGEDFYSDPASQSDFIDHWPADRIRFNSGEKWGLIPAWLGWAGADPRIKKLPAWSYRQDRAYKANLASHDIDSYNWPFDPEFRQPGTTTVPYWDDSGLARHDHQALKVTAWQRPGKCMVMLANLGTNRLEAVVKLDPKLMGLGEGDPNPIRLTQADQDLLTYFDTDLTTLKAPDAKTSSGEVSLDDQVPEMHLDERPEDLPLEERKKQDPDGKFTWKDGVLTCPVRRHDYRVFVFSGK